MNRCMGIKTKGAKAEDIARCTICKYLPHNPDEESKRGDTWIEPAASCESFRLTKE